MTITDKIAAWPRPAGRFFKPRSEWLTMKLYRAEAERDLALEVLRKLANDCDDIATDADLCDVVTQLREASRDARVFLAACGKGEG